MVATLRFRAILIAGFACAALIADGAPLEPAKPYRDVLRQQDVMVAARDGVLLATDIYRPATGGVAASERLPVLLHRTPYDKSEAATVAIANMWKLNLDKKRRLFIFRLCSIISFSIIYNQVFVIVSSKL